YEVIGYPRKSTSIDDQAVNTIRSLQLIADSLINRSLATKIYVVASCQANSLSSQRDLNTNKQIIELNHVNGDIQDML
ncbi:hypothetical protein BJ944DRAFT_155614, partial [Cunninghamella echinulata]